MQPELLGQRGGAAVQALGEHEHAVVLHVLAHHRGDTEHVALVGEQRERATSGDLGDVLEALALAGSQVVGPPGAAGVVREHEHRLAAVVERRREHCLPRVHVAGEPGHVAEVGERPGHGERGAGEHGAAQAVPEGLADLARRRQRRARERPARSLPAAVAER